MAITKWLYVVERWIKTYTILGLTVVFLSILFRLEEESHDALTWDSYKLAKNLLILVPVSFLW